MKKTTFFSLLTMLLLFVGSNVWADDELFYTLKTVPKEGSNHTSYNDYYDDEHDGMTWNAPGNQSLDGKWRIGGKSLEEVDRTITAKTPMGSAIDRVVVNHLGVSRTQVTINSMTVTVASDVEYTTIIDEVVLTPTIENGVSGSVEFEPSVGTEWPVDAYYKLTINVSNTSTSNGGIDLTSIQFFAPLSGVTIAKPVITPNGGTFTEPQQVTITAAEGLEIFYTIDGTEPAPTHSKYEAPFTVSESCTVKAVAYDVTGAHSGIAEAVFKFPTTITSIAELCEAEQGSVTVQFINWTVTGVKGKNAYFTDGANGILLYEDGHGFEVGDVLRGTATFNLTSYKNAPEITGLKATTEGVTIAAKNVEVTPMEVTIGQLEKNMQGCVIKLEDLTYTGGVFNDATGASITPYNTFNITMPTLEEGKSYDATGVAVWFDKWEIAPRTSDDFVETGTVITVAKPVITPAGGTFTEPQTVTITAGEGCTIYYTTDGTDPGISPVATGPNGTQYTAPFTVSENCTVKAIAYDVTGAPSAIASADFTFISGTAITSIAKLCAAAPAEGEVEVLVEFNNWIVTGVKGNQVYFTDGKNGIVNYIKGHGFEEGDVVTGSAVVTLTTYNECAEITSLTSTTDGVTVTKGEGATPIKVAIADLEKDMQGCLLTFEDLVYSEQENKFIDEDDNGIAPNNKFFTLPTLMDGKTYNVTGIAVWYVPADGSSYWAIAPRTADEIQLVTSQIAPESSWNVEDEITVDISEHVEAVFTTTSYGTVTYESSDESVAVIDGRGHISLIGRGTTTITANVAETEMYLPDSKSFILNVTADGYADATFNYNDEDIVGQGAPDTGAELTATRNDIVTLYANKAYAKEGETHIKFYGSKYDGKDADKVLSEPSYLRLSVVDGYSIVKVVMEATGDNYIKEWNDQYDTAVTINGKTATWEGDMFEVILTNQATAQARIKTVKVTYIDTSKVDAISLTPALSEGKEVIYNLAGQRLSKMQKGINIVGGKKIAVK